MTTIKFLGGEETGNVASVDWGRFQFTIGQPVECDDKHIIAKARRNRFFQVDEPATPDPPPIEKDRAAKAAKAAAEKAGEDDAA
jgi:hypothetical protein